MYDKSIDVVNSRDVRSPSGSDESVGAMAGRFPPPARPAPTTGGELDTDSDSGSEQERFINKKTAASDSHSRAPLRMPENVPDVRKAIARDDRRKPNQNKPIDSSENSDTDSNDLEGGVGALRAGGGGGGSSLVPPGGYDPKKFADLKVSPELDNLFQHILRYTPQKIELEYKLQPFIPEYVPAVGDIDGFIKVQTPRRGVRGEAHTDAVSTTIDHFGRILLAKNRLETSPGLTVLDEPAAEQSDSALLHLQLRALSKTSSAKSTMVTKKIENAEKNTKAVDRWIKDVSELHLSKPAPNVSYTVKMPDLDALMEEWPDAMEETLNNVGFPPSNMDCSLIEYVDLVCTMFDIPVVENSLNARIQALHMLFTLYTAVKTSQLYAERQKEEKSELE